MSGPSFLHRLRAPSVGLALIFASAAWAGEDALSVSPTQLMPSPGAREAELTIKAEGGRSAVLQVRVFRWEEGTPASVMYDTQDVIVNPPMAEILPRQELTVRLLRASMTPPGSRACYRVLVDRIPDLTDMTEQVALRIRHSVPLCFSG